MSVRRGDGSDEAERAMFGAARKRAPRKSATSQRTDDLAAALDAADTFAVLMLGKIKSLSGRERALAAELRRAVQLARTHLTGGAS
jgi:adenylosuccinate lyase